MTENKENNEIMTTTDRAYNDQEIIDLMRHCGHMLHRMPEHGGPRRRVLDLLSGESCSQKVLTAALGVAPASASELLSKMEADGLITREPLPTDRRGMKVCLTEKGMAQSYGPESDVAQLLSCLTDDEKQALANYLTRLTAHWQQKLPSRPPRGRERFDGPHGDRPPMPPRDGHMPPRDMPRPPHGRPPMPPHMGPHGDRHRDDEFDRRFDGDRDHGDHHRRPMDTEEV